MPARQPYLSIIIPAYNEAARLPDTLAQLHAFLNTQPYPAEILVIENGSTDGTLAIARGLQAAIPILTVLHEDTPGKGWAVRQGMLAARGQYRFICDADLSMPVSEIPRFLPPALPGAPVAIASREAPGAIRYDEPELRHLIGRTFNTLVRLLLLPGLNDTQCGFKCFSEQAAERIFPMLTIRGWTFDVEALFIARRLGYPVTEVPIPWRHKPNSRMRVLPASLQMGFDLLRVRFNALRGRYRA